MNANLTPSQLKANVEASLNSIESAMNSLSEAMLTASSNFTEIDSQVLSLEALSIRTKEVLKSDTADQIDDIIHSARRVADSIKVNIDEMRSKVCEAEEAADKIASLSREVSDLL